MADDTPYEIVEVWKAQEPGDRGQMEARNLIPDICDFKNGQPVREVGRPPAHPHCYCETAFVIRPAE
jgi:hypothetical protein